jgi:hypothetical protein
MALSSVVKGIIALLLVSLCANMVFIASYIMPKSTYDDDHNEARLQQELAVLRSNKTGFSLAVENARAKAKEEVKVELKAAVKRGEIGETKVAAAEEAKKGAAERIKQEAAEREAEDEKAAARKTADQAIAKAKNEPANKAKKEAAEKAKKEAAEKAKKEAAEKAKKKTAQEAKTRAAENAKKSALRGAAKAGKSCVRESESGGEYEWVFGTRPLGIRFAMGKSHSATVAGFQRLGTFVEVGDTLIAVSDAGGTNQKTAGMSLSSIADMLGSSSLPITLRFRKPHASGRVCLISSDANGEYTTYFWNKPLGMRLHAPGKGESMRLELQVEVKGLAANRREMVREGDLIAAVGEVSCKKMAMNKVLDLLKAAVVPVKIRFRRPSLLS